MKEKYILEIHKIIERASESQLLYILTFIKKVIGSI